MLKPKKKKRPVAVGTGLSYAIGSCLDKIVALLNATIYRKNPIQKSFVNVLAIRNMEVDATIAIVGRSASFGLLLFCIGLVLTLVYLIFS